jgi:antitoxin component YwqK of YwqJK toxin-antitoxin module
MREFWSPSKHDVFFKSGSHFKDSLPDGTYYYIPKRKKKEKKTSVEDLYESKGQYVNSVPSGRFEYYSLCSFSKRKRDIRVLTAEENYKDGLLHGYSFCGTCEFKLYEGNFKMGKRHGFFYEYDFFGNLILVELYQEGVLIHRSELRDITILKK